MILPNFFVVGTMKSGTATLKNYLNAHDEVFITGELWFFSWDERYKRGLDWFKSCFSEAKDEIAIGSKDPAYCLVAENDAVRRIKEVLPNVKLIWVFRNPVDRTYSNYWHAVNNGAEILSFEKALAEEEKRKRNFKELYHLCYVKRGMYVEQVKEYLKYFSIEQMHFIIFEEMIKEPKTVLEDVFKFLGVNYVNYDYSLRIHANKTVIPRSIPIQYYTRQIFGKDNALSRKVFRFNKKIKSGVPVMKDETRIALEKLFRKDNEILENIIGKDLSIWS